MLRIVLASWLAALATGAFLLSRYQTTPGLEGPASPAWPAGSSLSRAEGEPVVLLFAHPHCVCTEATIHELARILRFPVPETPRVVVVLAGSGRIADLARASGFDVFVDETGAESLRFGAATSGHVMFFDGSGSLAYSGGVTVARGHEGESAGGQTLGRAVAGAAAAKGASVFGCALTARGPAS